MDKQTEEGTTFKRPNGEDIAGPMPPLEGEQDGCAECEDRDSCPDAPNVKQEERKLRPLFDDLSHEAQEQFTNCRDRVQRLGGETSQMYTPLCQEWEVDHGDDCSECPSTRACKLVNTWAKFERALLDSLESAGSVYSSGTKVVDDYEKLIAWWENEFSDLCRITDDAEFRRERARVMRETAKRACGMLIDQVAGMGAFDVVSVVDERGLLSALMKGRERR